MDIRIRFDSKADIKQYVSECESCFDLQMDNCVKTIKSKEDLKFITLSGPTCSGKTTASEIITRELEKSGHKVSVVSIDDYFYDRNVLNSKKVLDYDSVDTIDLALLSETVEALEDGRSADIPIFDFKSGNRVGYRTYTPDSSEVIIFEGIQAVYPQVSCLFDKNDTLGIYISVANDAMFDDMCVDARTVRLLRRLVRDCKKRSSTPEFTLTLWESVCKNEDISIFPYENDCDIKLDSLLGYEFSVIKDRVLPLLGEIDEGSIHFQKARELEKIFVNIQSVDSSFVPHDSLFREFIP
ncbi:MAG: hypothetical protein E7635_05400 [Ruminococcaceae bacterium]|nr:hypothetical protein [Oscillospiraceae bacterium]